MSATPVTIGIPYRDEGQNLSLMAGGLIAALDELPSEIAREVVVCVNGSSPGFDVDLAARLNEAGLGKHGLRIVNSSEGKLAALRAVVQARREQGYLCFVDSDVVLDRKALRLLCQKLDGDPRCMIAYAQPVAVFPDIRNIVHLFLRVHYSLRERVYCRPFFHGRAFMLREWFFDEPKSLQGIRPEIVKRLCLELGPLVDDIAMSRMAVARWGNACISEVQDANVYFDTPDSLLGLYAGTLRVAFEIERLDFLYPQHAHLQKQVFARTWLTHRLNSFSWRVRVAHAVYRALDAAIKKAATFHVWLVKVGLWRVRTLWIRVPGTKSFPRIRLSWKRFKQLQKVNRPRP